MDDWELKAARDLELTRLERHRSPMREIGLVEASGRWMWWSLVRGYLRAFHRLRIHGSEHLPVEPPFMVVANHASHLDALCLGAALPMKHGERTFPLAAGDLFFENSSAAAFSALAINALPVWRKNVRKQGLLDLKTRLIEDRCIYILFPEGTRRRDDAMGRFRSGVGMFVAGTHVPVIPCWIDGAFEALPPTSRYPRPRNISVHLGPPQMFSEVEDDRAGRSMVAESLEKAVRRLAIDYRTQ